MLEQEAFVSQVRKEKLDNNAAWLAAKAEKEELSARRDREQRNSRESMNGGGAPSAASPPSAATALSPATLTTSRSRRVRCRRLFIRDVEESRRARCSPRVVTGTDRSSSS